MIDERDSTEPSEPLKAPPPATPLVYRSEDLLQGAREVLINHQGQVYRLRVTAAGKLILTK